MVRSLPILLLLGPVGILAASSGELRAEPPGGDTAAGDWDDRLLGAQACGYCHPREYATWEATPHARAWEVLPAADAANPECLSCHATADRPGFRSVQCESCHGPGRDYWPDFVMRDPHLGAALGLRKGSEVEVCARCHTRDTPSIRPFDHRKAIPAVDHGVGTGGRS